MQPVTWTIGDAQISQVTEAHADVVLRDLMGDATPQKLQQYSTLHPHFVDADGNMKGWFQSFLVTVGGKHILIEAGIGNGRQRPGFPGMHNLQTDFLQRLAATGIGTDQVDYVISSHLHIDHVGWFTVPVGDRWVPTFPNARYLIVRAAYDLWKDRQTHPDQMRTIAECVVPVVEAGVVDFVEVDYRLNKHVRLRPAPGHTPHHVAIEIESDGERAIFTGDVFPHPVVIMEPELAFGSDFAPEQAVKTRRKLLTELADTDTVIFSPHFADPVAVRIVTAANGHGFVLA
ncbi:MAG: MBL fold metallo-hydrolase [Chloroflexota bacterium]